jgi:hypothetical protein
MGTCLGELFGKLVLVIVNVLGVHDRPLEKPCKELDQLVAVHGDYKSNELFIGKVGPRVHGMKDLEGTLS